MIASEWRVGMPKLGMHRGRGATYFHVAGELQWTKAEWPDVGDGSELINGSFAGIRGGGTLIIQPQGFDGSSCAGRLEKLNF